MTTALNVSVSLPPTVTDPADDLWEHCRNALGIARLLVHDRRPDPLVATACRMAVEAACRLACEQGGVRWDGNLQRTLARLEVPAPLRDEAAGLSGAARLQLAERRVTWLASVLRTQVPGRPFNV
jgi:hypothetical protein